MIQEAFWMDGIGMVIIGHRFFKGTFDATSCHQKVIIWQKLRHHSLDLPETRCCQEREGLLAWAIGGRVECSENNILCRHQWRQSQQCLHGRSKIKWSHDKKVLQNHQQLHNEEDLNQLWQRLKCLPHHQLHSLLHFGLSPKLPRTSCFTHSLFDIFTLQLKRTFCSSPKQKPCHAFQLPRQRREKTLQWILQCLGQCGHH